MAKSIFPLSDETRAAAVKLLGDILARSVVEYDSDNLEYDVVHIIDILDIAERYGLDPDDVRDKADSSRRDLEEAEGV